MAVTELPFERTAMDGGEMPSGLCLAEQRTFLSLRILYAEYRKGNITRERASLEKKKLVRELESETKTDQACRQIAKLWAKIEQPSREYTFNPCLETADRFVAAVYGLSDNWRKKPVDISKLVFYPDGEELTECYTFVVKAEYKETVEEFINQLIQKEEK